ncbi:hypothetical protein ACFU8W_21800 [Streptomyces sp. NPDC057565]|uniref:hypothetical protein n=1 Tax=Streptomyces sp. NPDC057565 TaxID=3346169 RepID=UPI00369CFEF2
MPRATGVFTITAEPIENWSGVTTGSTPDEADPVVLECARLLAAEPGGEQTVPLTFALVGMAPYIVGRAAVDALGAAAQALETRPCARDASVSHGGARRRGRRAVGVRPRV